MLMLKGSVSKAWGAPEGGVCLLRFAFNGKENDNELKGTGNHQDYGFRVYDTRIAKFLSVDPLTKDYPWYTPYQFAGNTPIQAIDLDGLEPNYVNDAGYRVLGSDHTFNGNPGFKPLIKLVKKPESKKPPENQNPNFAWSKKDGVRAFGLSIEGPEGSGGLVGAGSNDGANTGNITKQDVKVIANGTDVIGNTAIILGYGALFVPGGQPLGAVLIEGGNLIEGASDALQFGYDVKEGNYVEAGTNFVFNAGNFKLNSAIDKSSLSDLSKDILKTGNDIKFEIGQKAAEWIFRAN